MKSIFLKFEKFIEPIYKELIEGFPEEKKVIKKFKKEKGKYTQTTEKLEALEENAMYRIKSLKWFARFFWFFLFFFIGFYFIFPLLSGQNPNCLCLLVYVVLQILVIILFIYLKKNMGKNVETYVRIQGHYDENEFLRQIKLPKDNSKVNETQSLMIKCGLVRGFLMIIVVVACILYYIIEKKIPIHFIIALNIILLYYEIKPKEVLPTQFVTKIPEKYGTIDRMPGVSNAVNDIKAKLKLINKQIDDFFDKFKDHIQNVKEDNVELNEQAKDYIKMIKDNTNKFTNVVNEYSIRGKSIWEQIGLMGILLFVGFLSIIYIDTFDDPFNAISITVSSILAAISISFGLNIQSLMINTLEKKINDLFIISTTYLNEIYNCLDNIINKKTEIKEKIEEFLDKLLAKNILIFFPKDIVAAFSINFMVLITGIMFLFPALATSEYIILGIEFIIGYYFLTKK